MKHLKSMLVILSVILFIIIFYFFKYKENFTCNQCPTTLLKDGNKILLYNPNLAKIPGVNPIIFEDLNDYEKYVQWQRVNQVKCPILKLNKGYDKMYEINSSNINTNLGQNQILSQDLNLGQSLNSNYAFQRDILLYA